MSAQMERVSSVNENPVITVKMDGTVLQSNTASKLLLKEWRTGVGNKLTPNIVDFIHKVISRNSPEKTEIKVGNRTYLVIFSPLPEQELVSISGFDISNQKDFEEKLRENDERYRNIVETAQEGIWLIDRNDRTFFVNQKMSYMLGYNIAEILGQSPRKFMAPEFLEKADDNLHEHIQGVPQKIDYRFIRKDGSDLWCILSLCPLFDNQGIFTASIAMITDITDRKNMEKALIDATERAKHDQLILEKVIQQMPVGIILTDPSGKTAKNNEAMDRIWRREMLPNENIESHSYVAYHIDGSEYQPDEWPLSRAQLYGEEIIGEEMVILRGDGTKGTVHVSSVPVKDETGQVIAGIVVGIDITDRKQAEEALSESELKYRILSNTLEEKIKERTSDLNKAYNSLKESEERLSEAQKMAHIGNWEHNFALNKLYWSDELYRIFRLNPQEIEVNYDLFLNYVHPDDIDNVKNTIKEALNGNSFDVNYKIILLSGETRVVQAKGEVVFGGNSNPIRIRGTLQDITESKRMEEQNHQRAEELEMIMDVAPVAIFIAHDPQGNNITGNRLANEYSEIGDKENLSANVVPGRRFFVKGHELTPDELPVQQAATKDIEVRNVEIEYLLPSGEYKVVLGSASPLHDTYGQVRGSIGAFIDITKRKKAEETLKNIEIARKQEIHHRIK